MSAGAWSDRTGNLHAEGDGPHGNGDAQTAEPDTTDSDPQTVETDTTGAVAIAVGGSATGEIETARERDSVPGRVSWRAAPTRSTCWVSHTSDGTLRDPYLLGIYGVDRNIHYQAARERQ